MWWRRVGRLKTDVSISSARQELRSVGDRLRRHYADDANWRFDADGLRDAMYGEIKPALLTLLAASGVLLLIACVNVANLLLSRATTRAQEVAMRRALGASQGRIFVQFLTENTVLALLGGGIGLFAAYLAVRLCGTSLPGRLGSSGVQINWAVACFALAVTVLTGLIFGCLPAI